MLLITNPGAAGLLLALFTLPLSLGPAAGTPTALLQPAQAPLAQGQPNSSKGEATEAVLARNRLRAIFKDDLQKNLIPKEARRFVLDLYDLNNDGKMEILVGLSSPYFCGSGGCKWLLLASNGALLTQFTVTRYPVIIHSTTTQGWRDLVLFSGSRYRLVRFNGTQYPANPSLQPQLKAAPNAQLTRVLNFSPESASWLAF